MGRTILWNLISSPFGGTVYPVNPNRPSILGVKAYPDLAAIPDPVDLAVIVTPAPTVPGIMAECVEKGVKGAIVISAGFKETGPAGVELERAGARAGAAGQHPAGGAELPGRDAPPLGPERHLRERHCPARLGRLHQPEWGAAHCRARLEQARERGLLGVRIAWLDARCGVGRPDLLPGRRPAHPLNRHLHGDDRRCALVPLGGAGRWRSPSRSS